MPMMQFQKNVPSRLSLMIFHLFQGVDFAHDIFCVDTMDFFHSMADTVESTPPRKKMKAKWISLTEVHTKLYGTSPPNAHHASDDAKTVLKCCLADAKRFIDYAENRAVDFQSIKALGQK